MEPQDKDVSRYVQGRVVVQEVTCPLCGGKATTTYLTYEVPVLGPLHISSFLCTRCGYKHSDVTPSGTGKAKKQVFKVKSKRDLYARVVRACTATIKIPELGVEIKPGPAAELFITNVEGVLNRVESALKSLAVLGAVKDQKSLEKALEKVKMAKAGNLEITIILEDPVGVSAIIPPAT